MSSGWPATPHGVYPPRSCFWKGGIKTPIWIVAGKAFKVHPRPATVVSVEEKSCSQPMAAPTGCCHFHLGARWLHTKTDQTVIRTAHFLLASPVSSSLLGGFPSGFLWPEALSFAVFSWNSAVDRVRVCPRGPVGGVPRFRRADGSVDFGRLIACSRIFSSSTSRFEALDCGLEARCRIATFFLLDITSCVCFGLNCDIINSWHQQLLLENRKKKVKKSNVSFRYEEAQAFINSRF